VRLFKKSTTMNDVSLERARQQVELIRWKVAAGWEPDGAECCFCGDTVFWQDAIQLVVSDDPRLQGLWAHKTCTEGAVAPSHRMFFWEDDEEEAALYEPPTEEELERARQQADAIQRKAAAGEVPEPSCCFCGEGVPWKDTITLVLFEQCALDSGEVDPSQQTFWAHQPCLHSAVQANP
jgi:hypothetical protein